MNATDFAKKLLAANKSFAATEEGAAEYVDKQREFFSLRIEYLRKFPRGERKQAERDLGVNPCGPLN